MSEEIRCYADVVKTIFSEPAPLIIIYGKKGTGKTDFSLLTAEVTQELGLVQKVATNIRTDRFELIDSYTKLKNWLTSDVKTKLFIFDEAGVYLPARRATSKPNVKMLKLAYLMRKYRSKWIFVTVSYRDLDPAFKSPDICTAVIKKVSKKFALIDLLDGEPPIEFYNVPKTSVSFDTYDIAFFDFENGERKKKEALKPVEKELEKRPAYLYVKYGTLDAVMKKLNLSHKEQARRLLKKDIEDLLKIVTALQREARHNI